MSCNRVFRSLAVLVGLGASLAACSAERGGQASSGTTRGAAGWTSIPTFTGAAGFPAVSGAASSRNAAPGTKLDPSAACGIGMVSAKLAPVNMFVMFDRSGSMDEDDKWSNATAALAAFFQSPGAAGLRVALRFFPHDEPAVGCTEDGCDANACSKPLVDLAALTADPAPTDEHEGRLVAAIGASAPGNGGGGNRNGNRGGGGGGGGTPIYAALEGALSWSTNYKDSHPTEKTVVIFLTDGEPNGCEEDFDAISALAANALATSGVTTYAIGLAGSREDQMDQLAQAGGTTKGIFIDNSATAQQELLSALDAIRGMTLSCDFPTPTSTRAGESVDPTKVNVTYTPGTGGRATVFGQVPTQVDCRTDDAWYYDNPAAPARIFLCPSACDAVRRDDAAQLQILLGCTTEIIAPD